MSNQHSTTWTNKVIYIIVHLMPHIYLLTILSIPLIVRKLLAFSNRFLRIKEAGHPARKRNRKQIIGRNINYKSTISKIQISQWLRIKVDSYVNLSDSSISYILNSYKERTQILTLVKRIPSQLKSTIKLSNSATT